MTRPKRKTVLKWIKNYPYFSYNHETSMVYCNACDINLKVQCSKYFIISHLSSKKHDFESDKHNDFYFDLIIFLVSCNIPWNKLVDPQFRIFFEKYLCCSCSSRKLPDENFLRKTHLNLLYNRTIEKISEKISTSYLWVSVDQTVVEGSHIVNVVIRELTNNACYQFYLIGRAILDKVDGDSIAEFIKSRLRFVLKNSYDKYVNNVLLLSTDSATHMLKAGKNLKDTFPNLLHVTCLVDGLHRVAEHIRSQYKNVDQFVHNVKKIFSESDIVRILKKNCPSVPLPPKPVETKWSMWLSDVLYYAEHFDHIIEIISRLHASDSAAAINETKRLLECHNLKNDLVYIKENYEFLYEAIIKLQTSRLPLVESFEILDNVRVILDWNGSNAVKLKLEEILDGIPDYDIIRDYADMIQKSECQDSFIAGYKYAPISSVDIEGSISSYTDKWNGVEKRTILKGNNLEKIMTILYYYREDDEDVRSTEIDFLRHILDDGAI